MKKSILAIITAAIAGIIANVADKPVLEVMKRLFPGSFELSHQTDILLEPSQPHAETELKSLFDRDKTRENPSKWLQGMWIGTGEQDGMIWDIQVVGNHDIFEVIYPSLNCKGELTLEQFDSGTATFKEKIHTGLCINMGRIVIVRKSEGSASFRWYYPNGLLGAQGSLSQISTKSGS